MGVTAAELKLIMILQEIGELLVPIMKLFTKAGYAPLYVLVIPFLYFVIDRRLALRVAYFQFLNMIFVALFKQLLRLPRPYWLDSGINPMDREISFGMPSGHAAGSLFWLYLAALIKKRWFWIFAAVMTFMIGISRIFLGVHFPTQVLAGWLLGGVLFTLFIKWETPFVDWFGRQGRGLQLTLALILPHLFILLGLLCAFFMRGWEMPAEWIALADPHLEGGKSIRGAVTLKNIMLFGGALAGISLATTLLNWWGGFASEGTLTRRLLRLAISFLFIVPLVVAFSLLAPGKERLWLYYLFRYLQFFSLTLVGFLVVPLFLRKVGLAKGGS